MVLNALNFELFLDKYLKKILVYLLKINLILVKFWIKKFFLPNEIPRFEICVSEFPRNEISGK
jgi:hypothetical protein